MEEQIDQTAQTPQEATSVGQFLKYTRLGQHKDLELVSKVLCIRTHYLKAIEEDDYKELPPVPYGMGFVRSYAAYLGLNAERLVQCYKEEAMPSKDLHTRAVVKAHPVAMRPNKRQIFIGLAVLSTLYATWLAFHSASDIEKAPVETAANVETPEISPIVENAVEDLRPVQADVGSDQEPGVQNDATEPEVSEETMTESVEVQPQVQPVQDEEQPQVQEQQAKTESAPQMTVRFKGPSWFELKDRNGQVLVSGIFGKGYEYGIPDQSGLIFSVGKYKNVDVYLNGKKIQIASSRKQTGIELDQYLKH